MEQQDGAPMDPYYLDRGTYESISEMVGKDAFVGFVDQFFSEFDEIIQPLKDLVAQQKGEEAAQTAHKVAGTAAVLGAAGVRNLLIEFEKTARSGEFAKCVVMIGEIEEVRQKLPEIMNP